MGKPCSSNNTGPSALICWKRPSRQWCSPDRCGNRVRVARYYQRHKAD
ncbi:CGNR zinc finger domain-containing protein [Nocardia sp. NPDC004722]